MKRKVAETLRITCSKCNFQDIFNQPYRYHAGFGNQGFLYNEAGNRTLIWDSYDPDYIRIVGNIHPWVLKPEERQKLEEVLQLDPLGGGRWLFSNSAKCLKCGNPIAEPITHTTHYLKYDGSLNGLKKIIKVD